MTKAIPAKDGALNYIQIRLPGWLKNAANRQATKAGVSLNAWMVEVIRAAVREERGIPDPPPAVAPLPTPADEIKAWIDGESILTPCGKKGSCDGTTNAPYEHGGMKFCRTCEIRIA